MRDPNRINPNCEKLAAVWRYAPDLRLTQLMINLMEAFTATHDYDAYYAEDEDFLAFANEYMKDVMS